MSSQFRPLEIPPGVVATGTKNQRSSNWIEANFVRWREGQLTPMGGQAQFTNVVGGVEKYVFASRCKMIHGWYGLDGTYHIAYLCEAHLYVDTGGTLTDISPTPAITPPSGLVGGFGDGLYDVDNYGTPRSIPGYVAITKVPDAYSLDNFGSILYAMTSADGRLLMWDPAVGGAAVVQPAASGRGPVPHGRCFVVTPGKIFDDFRVDPGRDDRRRVVAPLRMVRPGEPRRVGLLERHLPGGLPRHRARLADHRRHRDARRRPVLDRQENLCRAASSVCPTSTTRSSWPTGRVHGRRSRWPPPRRSPCG